MSVCPTAPFTGCDFYSANFKYQWRFFWSLLGIYDISGFPKCAHILPLMPFYVPSDVPGFLFAKIWQANVCAETLLQSINLYEVCSTPWAVSPGPDSALNKVERCSTHPTKQQPGTVVGRRYALPSNIVVLRRRRIENKNIFLLSLLKILCCGGAVLGAV